MKLCETDVKLVYELFDLSWTKNGDLFEKGDGRFVKRDDCEACV